jgi:hypothetical protein
METGVDPILHAKALVLAAAGRAKRGPARPAPHGREARATMTMITNMTTDTGTTPPAVPDRMPAEPQRTRVKPEISCGRASIRFNPVRHGRDSGGTVFSFGEERFYP